MTDLILSQPNYSVTLDVNSTVDAWLSKTVNFASVRAGDIKNDKGKAVLDFFDWIGKSPELVLPQDLLGWQNYLLGENLSEGTIYNRLSALSQYYDYLRFDGELGSIIQFNPAKVTLPKSPKQYSSETTKALSLNELFALLSVVENHAKSMNPRYLRDYAILQLFVVTGKRREEILKLKGFNIQQERNKLQIRTKVKGGYFVNFELKDVIAQDALFNYLEMTDRNQEIFTKDEPLWLRHQKGGFQPKDPKNIALTSHTFAQRMKKYADEAGINNFHIHKLRHTYAQLVAKKTGSIAETQEALGHSNIKTTQVYVSRLEVKSDKHSQTIREALENARQNQE